MTPETYRSRIFAIERWGQQQIDFLSSVTPRALPRQGESGAVADAVAGMARRQQNAERIRAVEAVVAFLSECVEADFYEMDRPTPERELRESMASMAGNLPTSE